MFRVSRKHRQRALSNLELAFPDWSEAERRRVALAVFEHFGRVTAEFLVSGRRGIEHIEATTTVEGLEHIEQARAQGRGVILVTGHFGNWERMSAWLSTHGYQVTVVARDADDDGANRIVNQVRSGFGTRVISRGNAARPMLEVLRQGGLVGILPDQNSDEAFLPFFGHPAGTVLGPGVLHERTGAPVVPATGVWVGPGRYVVRFFPRLEAQPTEVKGEGTMRAFLAWLEGVIREHPEQYLWFHDRWRNARRRGLL